MGNPSTAYEHWNYPPPSRRASFRAIRPVRQAFAALHIPSVKALAIADTTQEARA